MKKINQRQKRVAALSLATIISLNMTPMVFAQTNGNVVEETTSIENEIQEVQEIQEIQEIEVMEDIEVEGETKNDYIENKSDNTVLNILEIKGDKQTGSVHTINAKGQSKNGVLYKFYVKDLSAVGPAWTVIQDYSEKTSATWAPKKGGDYWYGVHIKDKNSKEAKDTHLYIPITIEGGDATVLDSLEIKGNKQTNSAHTINAKGQSKNGVLYKFYVKDLNAVGPAWTVIQDYSEKTSASWTPKKGGNYWYGVHIKDKNSKKDKDTHLYTPITIRDAGQLDPAEVERLEITGKLEVNSPQVLKAHAKSPNKALYKFYIKDLNAVGSAWTVIQDYSEKTSATWTPKKAGNYWYGVHVKDIDSKNDKDNHLYKNVSISLLAPAKLDSFTISGSGYEKTNHTLRAEASSTNNVLYRFYIKDLSTNKWAVIQDYSKKNTVNWKPGKPGKYWYGVHIKDEFSDRDKDTHLYTPITINPPVYYNVTEYDDTLEQALNKQVGKNKISRNGEWVPATKDEIRQYLDPNRFLQFTPEGGSKPCNKIGTITTDTLNVRSGPATTYGVIASTSRGKTHEILSESNGWYQIDLGDKSGWVSAAYVSVKTDSTKGEDKHIISLEITASTLSVRTEPNTTSQVVTSVKSGDVYVVLEDKNGWHKINAGGKIGWVSSEFTRFVNDVPRDMYQFMVLSGQAGVTASQMNIELKGQGILDGKGAAFIEGSKKYNVNELYLMAHAFLETGKGTSQLARGVLVSEVDGKPVTPRVVYNMYGINAFDATALKSGSERAYKEGWFTPEIAITEGAHWISNNYINNPTYKQDTLYKMKYNPASPGTHQYATDIAWALKQTRQIDIMMDLYKKIDSALLRFDIPKYR